MLSNLPPGCSQSDIPGCRPEDLAIEQAIENKECYACNHWTTDGDSLNCNECSLSDCEGFEKEEDEALIGERLKSEAEAREDGHRDE